MSQIARKFGMRECYASTFQQVLLVTHIYGKLGKVGYETKYLAHARSLLGDPMNLRLVRGAHQIVLERVNRCL